MTLTEDGTGVVCGVVLMTLPPAVESTGGPSVSLRSVWLAVRPQSSMRCEAARGGA